ncbi:DUF3305 domain-containing protein [Algicella marina]|uniref:DUF3305 domain-containing protein n=1 Tax=Algicella marina TaxID=2683284 RepID=A0A6P1T0W2_9RHOB|nr:DUF3305 domain-containing protein [Algicella marina]QHQ35283.1 DUF3305 domain-containing protein [Algicella marina]
MSPDAQKMISIPIGVVVRREPGVTRWAQWNWRAVAVLPGAATASWKVMRHEGEAVEYHAGTLPMKLFRTDTEAYLVALNAEVPSVYVVLRKTTGEPGLDLHRVTASPYEAQDYLDSGEDIVEKVPMPIALRHMIENFVEAHHSEAEFVKRKRDRIRTDVVEDGKGDARIRQAADVYRAPSHRKGGTSS